MVAGHAPLSRSVWAKKMMNNHNHCTTVAQSANKITITSTVDLIDLKNVKADALYTIN